MDGSRRLRRTSTDQVEASRVWRPSPGHLAVALGIVAGSLGYGSYWLVSSMTTAPVADKIVARATLSLAASASTLSATVRDTAAVNGPTPAEPVREATAAGGLAAAAPLQVSRTRDTDGDLTPDLSVFVNHGERPTMTEVIDRLHQAGVHAGLGAFSPPGTRPPLVGIAVPENFELPEGYVRHYQATDDGQRIEAILMFSPDHAFVDAARRPVAIPKDRVVPPEYAPPGLPVRRIVIPTPAETGRPGS